MITRHIKVIGRVQGIGFRRWAEDVANGLNLSGWVRNNSDGAVEIMVKGEEYAINQFLQQCQKGPAFSMVLGIQPAVMPTATPVPIEEGVFKIVASV